MSTESSSTSIEIAALPPASNTATTAVGTGYTRKKRILLVLLGIHAVISLFAVAPGHLSVDEGVYHMMSESFATDHSLAIWNGYEEFPSPELALIVGRPINGQLFPQYPHVYTFLAAPIYAGMGYRGLFLLNAIAFVGVTWLTFLLAVRLFRDREMALNAVLILALATYAWEYSQAAWPHMTALFFVLTIVHSMLRAVDDSESDRPTAFALMAGMAAGVGVGVRLDVLFVVPAVLAWTLFVRPYPKWASAQFLVGMLPGLVLLTVVNHIKFGTWSPISYGASSAGTDSVSAYFPLAAGGALALLFVWGAVRWRKCVLPNKPWFPWFIGLVAIGLLAASVPQARTQLYTLFYGTYQLIIDLRVRDLGIYERGLTRGPDGGMIYLGSLKKSLLQSCPYLVLLLVPLWQLLRGRDDTIRLALPFFCIGAYVASYGYFAWHGGLSLNLRYFLPILPFTAILTAYAIREISPMWDSKWTVLMVGVVLCIIAIHAIAMFPERRSIEQQEFIFLTMPLVIAAAMLVFVLLWVWPRARRKGPIAGMLQLLFVAGITWSELTAFTYDVPRTFFIRKSRVEFSERIAADLLPDSILFVTSASPFYNLIGDRRIRVAVPAYDEFRDFVGLARFHLTAGRPVYLFMDPIMSAEIERRGLSRALRFDIVSQDELGAVARLRAISGP